MKPSAVLQNLPWLKEQAEVAAACANRARTMEEYSGYAVLRDALRSAVNAMQDIDGLPDRVRERIEGGES